VDVGNVDVSGVHAASIFRVEVLCIDKTMGGGRQLSPPLFLAYFPILKRVGLWDHVAAHVFVCVCVCVSPLLLLANGSVKVPFSLLGNGYVFSVVHVVSKERRRLVLSRTCFSWNHICTLHTSSTQKMGAICTSKTMATLPHPHDVIITNLLYLSVQYLFYSSRINVNLEKISLCSCRRSY
jgi:hypothetical protein